jgi:hypothetical protein
MPSVAVRVHQLVATHPFRRPGSRCPAVRCPARPVSSPSSVQPVQCPARPVSGHLAPSSRIRLSGRLVSSPSGVQPSGVRPSAQSSRIRLVRVSPAVALGDTSVRRGNLHDWNESSSMWSGPVPPSGSVGGLSRPGRGQRCGGHMSASGGGSPRTWPGCAWAGEAAADRPGRPDRREGRPVDGGAAPGQGSWLTRDVPAFIAWLPSWAGCATTLRGCRGA